MKICFVCPHAYPLFEPSSITPFGGAEVRAWLLATGLGRNPAHDVSFVVFDHGQGGPKKHGDVTVYPHSWHRHGPAAASSILSRLSHRVKAAVERGIGASLRFGRIEIEHGRTRVYEQIGADAYCVFGVGDFSAEVAAHCAAARRKLVLLASSDSDFSADYQPGSHAVNAYGSSCDTCHRVVMAADLIVAQTEAQRDLLRGRFGRDATVIRNPVDMSGAGPDIDREPPGDGIALWIGKSDPVKQPLLLLELARALPDVRFTMVMNRSDPAMFDQVSRQLPPNVEMMERVAFDATDRLFQRASILINTSIFEGFPNTFLQAGKHGVPVLSLNVDPDGFISRHRCGIAAGGDSERLAQGLRKLSSDRQTWKACSGNIRRYVDENHRLDDRVRELDALLTRSVFPTTGEARTGC